MDKKSRISGPGAADFLTAEGGVDFPETDSSKGMRQTRDENLVEGPAELEPDLEAPDPDTQREKTIDPRRRP